MVTTPRLVLRPFDEVDLTPFHRLNTDPRVVEWLGSSPTHAESDAMAQRFRDELAREGWGFWAVEVAGGPRFVGMVGLHRVNPVLPFAPGVEIGWRLHPDHWGHGYATEAAVASLGVGFDAGLDEIVAFTATRNMRSQSVMERIGMRRDPLGDFDHPSLAYASPLRSHVLYRIVASQVRPTVQR